MEAFRASIRRQIAKAGWLSDYLRDRRARRQEFDYVRTREYYMSQAGPVFAAPGWRAKSLNLLYSRWPGPRVVKPSLHDTRIFVAAADDPGGPVLLKSLMVSCDVELFDLGAYRSWHDQETAYRMAIEYPKWRPRLQRDCLEAFRAAYARNPIDVVFAYGSYLDFDPETFRAMSRVGVPVLDLCLDDKHIFWQRPLPWPNGQRPLIGAVDVHLTNSLETLRWYIGEGVPAYFLPQGIDTDLFRPLDVEKTIDVCFIGQHYGMRGKLVEALRAVGINVVCFGPGWETRIISEAEKVEMYSRARINLGVGGTGLSGRVTCIKGRDLEVPACGAVYLTTFNPELIQLFDVGKEILCYLNEIDCAETIRYFLERPEEARAIGAVARARCVRDHTWQQRLRDLFTWMGIVAGNTQGSIDGHHEMPLEERGATPPSNLGPASTLRG